MPLHGKIVVVKRSGGDGTEFPLTATCLFGRKPDCDIRIQLPQVSKEHCRIDLNENKEVILTNLSSVNPTRVNGEVLQQSERLKHGDVITIIDRSFRFEYPPAPTPKKRSSIRGKPETFKVLQDQQVGDTAATETAEKRTSQVSTDPPLKDGTNQDNIQRSLEKTVELESKEDDGLLQNKSTSPFNDLYQMIKKSLDVKTPRKSCTSLLQTPTSRFCTPKPDSVRKSDGKPTIISTEEKGTPKKDEAKMSAGAGETEVEAEHISNGNPKSVKKQRRSFQVPSEMTRPEADNAAKTEASSPLKKNRATPQKFTVCEVIEQVCAQTPKSPMRRRSKEATPAKPAMTSPKTEHLQKTSPRNSGKVEKVKEASKKRKSGELAASLPTSEMKKKRVSFGGHLSPELFDKRLPPDSPLRKGATPRRSLCLFKPKQSLLRRASVIGLLQEFDQEHPDSPNVQRHAKMTTPSPKKPSGIKNASPKTPSPGKKSPKSSSPSPKAATPAKKSPKSSSPSPKAATPAKKSPKSSTSSPKAATPAKKSPKSSTPSPKATTLGAKSPKSKSPSPARARSPSGNKVETPRFQTPTVQGRFSVSRINTPSPVVEDAVTDRVPFVTVTPKIPLKRKSMKSTSRKTPRISKSALTVMRRSGISRASIKATSSFADIVKFGQTKAQVAAPPKKTVTKKTMKKAVSKSQVKTPARKLKDHVTTGHAESPVTIVVGRAHKQKVVYPTGAAPKLVINTAFLKKNMKMDEDLTGISEMYKTPVNERKRRSVINDSSAMKTPLGALGSSVVEPSVLNTPEEPDEMMVSPLSVSSTIKDRRYNSEAVQRLLNEDEGPSFISDTTAMETRSDCSSEQQCTDLKTTSVTTPKQKPEQQECLTGVKRIMKTPRQRAEPVEDLRGKLLKTPKQKPEQQECLTGVKRIMKTPRQRAEPVEDLRGKLLKTPKQKPEQQECLTGVKRIMKTPRQRAEPVEDLRGTLLKTPKQKPEQQECLTGVKRIFKTPQQEAEALKDLREKLLATPKALEAGDMSSHGAKEIAETSAHMQESEMKTPNVKRSPLVGLTGIKRIMTTPKEKSAPVEDLVGVKRLMKTPREKSEPVEENFGIKRLLKSPRLRGNAAVEDFEGLQELMEEPLETNEVEHGMPLDCDVDVAKEVDANEVAVDDHLKEVPSAHDMAGKVSEVDTTAMDPDHKKKSARGRRAKTVESKVAKDAQEATEPEDPVVSAPVRGRRGKKTEATAPPAARQTTRGRNAKTAESKDAEVAVEESASLPSKVALKPKRGRNVKKISDDQEVAAETAIMPEPESEQSPPADVDHDSAAPLEKAVVRPKRGRKTRQPEQSVPEQQDAPSTHSDSVPHADLAKEDTMETVPQSPANMGLPEVETTCKVAEIDEAIVQKKSVRGRRAKTVEPASAEDKQEVAEHSEDPVVAASVSGRRGKKTEATTPPAARQTTRGRNTKSQERLETLATKISAELVSGHTSPIKTQEEEHDSAPPAEKAVVKPTRGRKTKQTPVELPPPEPERNEAVSEEHLVAEAQPQKSAPTPVKSRRGRKTKPDTVEQKEAAEETVVTVETKQQSRPTVRAKRGRNAKQEEEKLENDDKSASVETIKPQEPVKKLRRTRNAEQDPVETREDGQTVKMVVPEEAEVPFVVEPVSMNEQATVAAKPRRGGRKAKQDTESETPVEPTEVPALSSADKPKRGRRGKQVAEEVEVSAEVPEEKPVHELNAEEKNNAELDAPVVKRGRARGVKNEVSTPAKRARRGAALEETNAEPTVPASESASTSAEPAKRGRRAAAKPATDDATVTSNQADPTEDLSHAVVEDTKTSKRAVKWKTNLEVFEIPKVTPVKAVRGRKSKPEEKDLSDKAIEARPVEKARRGAKAVVITTDEATSKVKSAEAETQPKTRRGRSAKK